MNATHEEWRPVVGYEDSYEVSDHGRVRSLDRTLDLFIYGKWTKRRYKGRILRPFKGDAYGHQVVSFGARDRHYIHTIVLTTFVGARPDGAEACHNDGDPHNNRSTNLRWDTASNNQLDRLAHGTHHYARRTHCKHGHEYTPENTQWRIRNGPRNVVPSVSRVCLKCRRERYIESRGLAA